MHFCFASYIEKANVPYNHREVSALLFLILSYKKLKEVCREHTRAGRATRNETVLFRVAHSKCASRTSSSRRLSQALSRDCINGESFSIMKNHGGGCSKHWNWWPILCHPHRQTRL